MWLQVEDPALTRFKVLDDDNVIDTTCNVRFKVAGNLCVGFRLNLSQGAKDLTGSLNDVESKLLKYSVEKLRLSSYDFKQEQLKRELREELDAIYNVK